MLCIKLLSIRKYHVLWLKKCKAAGAPPQTPLGELKVGNPHVWK